MDLDFPIVIKRMTCANNRQLSGKQLFPNREHPLQQPTERRGCLSARALFVSARAFDSVA